MRQAANIDDGDCLTYEETQGTELESTSSDQQIGEMTSHHVSESDLTDSDDRNLADHISPDLNDAQHVNSLVHCMFIHYSIFFSFDCVQHVHRYSNNMR